MILDAFLKTAWADHGDHPQDVAARLAANLALLASPEQLRPYAGLVAHVYGEHLGQWQAGIGLLEAMRKLPACDGSPAAADPIARSIATLAYAGGDAQVLQSLTRDDRAFVLASAAAMFTGRGEFGAAITAYGQALQAAEAGLPASAPAVRALAMAGNNLAQALEARDDCTAAQLQAMVTAAEGGLAWWRKAGTWLEEERAEYQLTRSLLKAGQAQAAIRSAERCIDICKRNAAPAFEQFFGHAVLALAHRAAGSAGGFAAQRDLALEALAQVPEDERRWCDRERKELGGA